MALTSVRYRRSTKANQPPCTLPGWMKTSRGILPVVGIPKEFTDSILKQWIPHNFSKQSTIYPKLRQGLFRFIDDTIRGKMELPCGVAVIDTEGIVLTATPSFCDHLGITHNAEETAEPLLFCNTNKARLSLAGLYPDLPRLLQKPAVLVEFLVEHQIALRFFPIFADSESFPEKTIACWILLSSQMNAQAMPTVRSLLPEVITLDMQQQDALITSIEQLLVEQDDQTIPGFQKHLRQLAARMTPVLQSFAEELTETRDVFLASPDQKAQFLRLEKIVATYYSPRIAQLINKPHLHSDHHDKEGERPLKERSVMFFEFLIKAGLTTSPTPIVEQACSRLAHALSGTFISYLWQSGLQHLFAFPLPARQVLDAINTIVSETPDASIDILTNHPSQFEFRVVHELHTIFRAHLQDITASLTFHQRANKSVEDALQLIFANEEQIPQEITDTTSLQAGMSIQIVSEKGPRLHARISDVLEEKNTLLCFIATASQKEFHTFALTKKDTGWFAENVTIPSSSFTCSVHLPSLHELSTKLIASICMIGTQIEEIYQGGDIAGAVRMSARDEVEEMLLAARKLVQSGKKHVYLWNQDMCGAEDRMPMKPMLALAKRITNDPLLAGKVKLFPRLSAESRPDTVVKLTEATAEVALQFPEAIHGIQVSDTERPEDLVRIATKISEALQLRGNKFIAKNIPLPSLPITPLVETEHAMIMLPEILLFAVSQGMQDKLHLLPYPSTTIITVAHSDLGGEIGPFAARIRNFTNVLDYDQFLPNIFLPFAHLFQIVESSDALLRYSSLEKDWEVITQELASYEELLRPYFVTRDANTFIVHEARAAFINKLLPLVQSFLVSHQDFLLHHTSLSEAFLREFTSPFVLAQGNGEPWERGGNALHTAIATIASFPSQQVHQAGSVQQPAYVWPFCFGLSRWERSLYLYERAVAYTEVSIDFTDHAVQSSLNLFRKAAKEAHALYFARGAEKSLYGRLIPLVGLVASVRERPAIFTDDLSGEIIKVREIPKKQLLYGVGLSEVIVLPKIIEFFIQSYTQQNKYPPSASIITSIVSLIVPEKQQEELLLHLYPEVMRPLITAQLLGDDSEAFYRDLLELTAKTRTILSTMQRDKKITLTPSVSYIDLLKEGIDCMVAVNTPHYTIERTGTLSQAHLSLLQVHALLNDDKAPHRVTITHRDDPTQAIPWPTIVERVLNFQHRFNAALVHQAVRRGFSG